MHQSLPSQLPSVLRCPHASAVDAHCFDEDGLLLLFLALPLPGVGLGGADAARLDLGRGGGRSQLQHFSRIQKDGIEPHAERSGELPFRRNFVSSPIASLACHRKSSVSVAHLIRCCILEKAVCALNRPKIELKKSSGQVWHAQGLATGWFPQGLLMNIAQRVRMNGSTHMVPPTSDLCTATRLQLCVNAEARTNTVCC